MTIKLVTAPPRTGKSLYVVHKLNKERDKLFIISNIDGYAADVQINNPKEMQDYILNTDWAALAQANLPRKTILVIDECQSIYGNIGMAKEGSQKDLLYFLEYHGHYGINIYLITQGEGSLHARVKPLLSEHIEISTIKPSKNVWTLIIRSPQSGEIIERKSFTATQADYASYTSALNEEGLQTNRTPLKRLLIITAVALIAVLIFGYLSIKNLAPEEKKQDLKQETKPDLKKDLKQENKTGIALALKLEEPRLTGMIRLNYNSGKGFNPLALKNMAFFNKADCSLNQPRAIYCEEFDFKLNIALCNKELYYLEPCDIKEQPEQQTPEIKETELALSNEPKQ